ncbi:CIC11C00000000544 [Sungouiella intermedia]|uniref:CIC11C00000000544 n=1 Tax=Sungouiella intermedia TaxID=45354 RepID=A0A1L0DNZ4_9ASCO|nr:CIC11C00000004094 [[Candida] intermedia]SGZ57568.1 CIC11C00000000544 [[Candida] intermedia]
MSLYLKEHEIKGKTALITGGTKNLGAATAKELARYGANLFLHYHSKQDQAELDELAKELSTNGSKVEFYQASLQTGEDVEKLFKAAKEKFPQGIDIAINNVGQVLKKPITDVTDAEFEKMDVNNNKVAFFFIREAGKSLNNEGKIVSLVTSLLAAYTPFYGVYQGTKAPVEYYTKAASKELTLKNISVNSVAPGPMDTPFLYGQETDDDIKYYKTVGLHQRLTKVEDIVPIVRFLVTEGGWITGQTIYASGGFTAH